jgi:transcriptional regulator with XRE-family HTH domain
MTTEFATRLKCFRERAGLSVAQVAARAGVSRSMLHHMEAGTRRNVGVFTLMKIADVLGAYWEEIAWGELPPRAYGDAVPPSVDLEQLIVRTAAAKHKCEALRDEIEQLTAEAIRLRAAPSMENSP